MYDFDDKFEPPSDRESGRESWMKKIEDTYGIDLRDADDKNLNVVVLGNELERRLEWKLMQDK